MVRRHTGDEDADTLYFEPSFGCDQYGFVAIRLRDVSAPELRTRDPLEKQRAIDSLAFLESLIPDKTQCRVHTDRASATQISLEDKTFTRYVGVIETAEHLAQIDLQTGRPIPGMDGVNAVMREWLSEKGYTGGA